MTPVRSFFPDPEAFEALSRDVLPRLLREKAAGAPVRVWAPGCAKGEEVYAIAICLLEQQEVLGTSLHCRVFGTDVSGEAIHTARAGTYPDRIVQHTSPDRLRRFFTRVDDGYKVSRAVRDICVFAQHDLLADIPFSKMDLISCRNLLLHLEPEARRHALANLHYSLQAHGFLMIGSSEPLDAPDQFTPWAGERGIYARTGPPGGWPYPARSREATAGSASYAKDRRIEELERDLDDSRERVEALLEGYDSAGEVLRNTSQETLAASEDLRNINEELQTAREQVQSANEELEMLNQELHQRNRELGYAADDMVNLLDSLRLPIVMVGSDLRLRRFTSSAEKLLNLLPRDVGRPLGDLRTNLEAPGLSKTVQGVIETLSPVDRKVNDGEGRGYVLRILPYRTRDGKVDGAVILLMDVEALKAT